MSSFTWMKGGNLTLSCFAMPLVSRMTNPGAGVSKESNSKY